MPNQTTDTILVLGATGVTGGQVARQLIEAGYKPRLLVRTRAKAVAFENKATIFEGDLDNDAQVASAVAGIEKLYLVSAGLPGRFQEVRVIDAAKRAGVRHVVKLSVLTADQPEVTYAHWHAGTEKHLRDSGMAWTMLRPAHFQSNALFWADTIKSQSVFYQATGEGKWAAVDPKDIGAVAVKALTTTGHEGKAYALTGPESTNAAGYAAILANALERPLSFVDVPAEQMKSNLVGYGLPEEYVDAAMELMAATKANDWDQVSPDVKAVLGRPAGTFDEWAKRHAAAFS